MTVNWDTSVNNGDPITSYHIQIRGTDGVSFYDELTGCDGTNSYYIEKTECLLSVATIQGAPYNLKQTDHIHVRVASINSRGASVWSTVGNGALAFLSTVPDKPVSLLRDETNTFSGQIGITWSDGAYNGGQPITAYRVSFDQGTNNYIVIASTVT